MFTCLLARSDEFSSAHSSQMELSAFSVTTYMWIVTNDTIYIIDCRILHVKRRTAHNLLFQQHSVQL